ncbi:MAG: YihA family ribosome biogenesis GTP-binding protein [Chitinophagaceae bacterium]|nr:YihA family ribosome biogenesis GTP-binding protein [Chitinophagaceae bacterium]MBK7557868.1 YihA family ribosome biogenesis GTP-binding protein [Chitinophagaceae bacterium]MBK8493830.1 YihA family ribosome biogenesis GTP-binding protein [Chitinophagaceae bacterium]MBK9531560.1 YihA family ribosome biogenesis GTP-binding protein [Chitinophagaceae bacterium]HQW92401.1 ribosome biogenesis GTP-binding protein YihA/YsxC [Ferruginibacter sp.]
MQIKSAKYIISSPGYEKCPVPDKPEYAFIGRSNVGKSSLINMLCNNDKLAKTSGSPGKTQLLNHFEISSSPTPKANQKAPAASETKRKQWYLVDLPGYGFAKVSIRSRNRWEQMIENYLRKRENLTMVFVLIDARHSPQKIDLEFLDQLRTWQVPFCLVFTKSDKENQRMVSKNVKAFLEAMKKTWQFLPQHFVSSAVKKTGKEKILSFIEETNNSLENTAG